MLNLKRVKVVSEHILTTEGTAVTTHADEVLREGLARQEIICRLDSDLDRDLNPGDPSRPVCLIGVRSVFATA